MLDPLTACALTASLLLVVVLCVCLYACSGGTPPPPRAAPPPPPPAHWPHDAAPVFHGWAAYRTPPHADLYLGEGYSPAGLPYSPTGPSYSPRRSPRNELFDEYPGGGRVAPPWPHCASPSRPGWNVRALSPT